MVYFKVVTIRCICLTGKSKKKGKKTVISVLFITVNLKKKTKVYCYILGKTKSFKKKRDFIGCFF